MNLLDMKAFAGEKMVRFHLKSMERALGVRAHHFPGEMDIWWDEIRDGDKETILFIHGFSDRKESFYFIARALSRKYNIIIPQLPGFGDTEKQMDISYGIWDYVRWLTPFLKSVDVEKVHLVGHSLGGAIGACLAVECPGKVSSLTLVNSAGFLLENYNTFYDEFLNGRSIFYLETVAEYEAFRRRIFYNDVQMPELVKAFMMKEMMDSRDWYQKILTDMAREMRSGEPEKGLKNLLSDLPVPVNIIWGKEDTLFPWQVAVDAHETITDSTLELLENVGHCPHMETPAKFIKILDTLLSST